MSKHLFRSFWLIEVITMIAISGNALSQPMAQWGPIAGATPLPALRVDSSIVATATVAPTGYSGATLIYICQARSFEGKLYVGQVLYDTYGTAYCAVYDKPEILVLPNFNVLMTTEYRWIMVEDGRKTNKPRSALVGGNSGEGRDWFVCAARPDDDNVQIMVPGWSAQGFPICAITWKGKPTEKDKKFWILVRTDLP